MEALVVVDGPFFGDGLPGLGEHRFDLGVDVVGIPVGRDPCAVEDAAVVAGEARDVDAG